MKSSHIHSFLLFCFLFFLFSSPALSDYSTCDGKKLGTFCEGGVLIQTGEEGIIMAVSDAGQFNWDDAQRSCPPGWEVPTSDELFLMHSSFRGDGIDANGRSSNNFCVLGRGACLADDPWYPTQYWTSQENDEIKAFSIDFQEGKPYIRLKTYGYSLRCIKREEVSTSRTTSPDDPGSTYSGDWAEEYIEILKEEAVVNPSGGFRGGDSINRAEAVKMTVLASYVEMEHMNPPFSDVSMNDWFSGYVATAYYLGWVGGYGDGSFRPNSFITRAEATKLFMNASQKPIVSSPGNRFSDVSESDWFFPFISSAVEEGVVSGYPDGSYRPNTLITRNEFAKMTVLFFGLNE